MLPIRLHQKHREQLKQAYELGLNVGFEFGYKLGQNTKKGFIFSAEVERQINELLQKEG